MTFTPAKSTCVPKSVQSNTVLLQSESEVHSTKSNTLITLILFCLFIYFQRCDVVECEIDEIGCISNTVQLKGLLSDYNNCLNNSTEHCSQRVCNPDPFLKHQITN